MEMIIGLQIGFLLLMLAVNLLCVFLPVKIVNQNTTGNNSVLLELCNSVSAGVFLGTCYVQLVPYVESKFRLVFQKAELNMEYCDVVTQCMIMAGFFLIVIVEQVANAVRKKRQTASALGESGMLLTGVSSVDVDSFHDSSDSDSEPDESKRRMLGKQQSDAGSKRQSTAQAAATQLRNGEVHSRHAEGHSTDDGGHSRDGGCRSRDGSGHSHDGGGHSHHGGGHSHDSGGHWHHGGGHGHSHLAEIVDDEQQSALRCVLLLVALSCHSLFEGLALGLQDSVTSLVQLFIGVLVHECLVAFAVGVSLAQRRRRLRCVIIVHLGIVFSIMIPLGMAVGMALGELHGLWAEILAITLQAVAAGTFVYVIFLEVLPAEINAHDHKIARLLFLFFGFFVILCLRLGLHDEHSPEH